MLLIFNALFSNHRLDVIVVIVLSLFVIAFDGFSIFLFIPFIYNILSDNDTFLAPEVPYFTKFIVNPLENYFALDDYSLILIFVAVIFILKIFFIVMQGICMAKIKSKVVFKYRKDYLQNFLNTSFDFIKSQEIGLNTNILSEQLYKVSLFVLYLLQCISLILATLIYVLVGIFISFKTGFYILSLGLIIFLLYLPINIKIKKLSIIFTEYSSDFSSKLVQYFRYSKYLYTTKKSKSFTDMLIESADQIKANDRKIYEYNAFALALKEPILIFSILTIFFIEIHVLNNDGSKILISIAFLYRGLTSALSAQKLLQKAYENLGAFDKFINANKKLFLSLDCKDTNIQNGYIKFFKNLDINLENATFSYKEINIIQDQNINIPFGTSCAIMGRSGVGKSTLLNILCGNERLSKGNLYIGGKLLSKENNFYWKKNIGYVSQEPTIFNGTILQNVTLEFGDFKTSKPILDKFNSIMELVGLGTELKNDDYQDIILTDNGSELSGGQKQRLQLARELFLGKKILILDEPTSALDKKNENIVSDLLKLQVGKITIICVTHSLNFVKNFDQIITLEN
jgi:subfamily B ATP-binding cassette protein MsbA